MTVHLSPEAAETCIKACDTFMNEVRDSIEGRFESGSAASPGCFQTAAQLSGVYASLVGTDLATLVQSFVDQAEAMSMLFATAGGMLSAQDESVAAALGKATGPAPKMTSLAAGSLVPLIDSAALPALPAAGYSAVGPEDVAGAQFEQIKAGAEALHPEQFDSAATQLTATAEALSTGADQLRGTLSGILGGDWRGEFAHNADYSAGRLAESATQLADSLTAAAAKATAVSDGWGRTRSSISMESYAAEIVTGPGIAEAATEQARHVVNTVYNPAVMDANLTDLDFPAAYRVVNSTAVGAPGGIDAISAWNTDGRIEPAAPASPASAGAASGAADGGAAGAETARGGGVGSGGISGAGTGAGAGATSPSSPVDATTQSALHAGTGREAVAGTGAAGAAAGPGGGGLNAATTAAAAPLAGAGTAVGGNASGAGANSTSTNGRRRDQRGYGAAASGIGAGAGAAGLGVGAYGGAGTLAGGGAGSGGAGSSGGAGAAGRGMPGAFGAGGTTPATGSVAGGSAAAGTGQGMRGGMLAAPMMAPGAGQGRDGREGHAPAGYLVDATNTNAIIGDPPKVSPAVLGRSPRTPAAGADSE